MHSKEILELAAIVASRSAVFLQGTDPLPTSGVERYWTASKCRFERWAIDMKRFQRATQANRDRQGWEELGLAGHNDPEIGIPDDKSGEDPAIVWRSLKATIAEILASEVLTRIWSALLCEHDMVRGVHESAPIARSVFVGHLEARHRALGICLNGRGVPHDDLVELNRLRRQCERWNELLLGSAAPYVGCVGDYAFDRKTVEDKGVDGRGGPSNDGHFDGQRVPHERLTASLRAAFHGRSFGQTGNGNLNDKIASGVLCCLNENFHVGTTAFASAWLRRLWETADETSDWIQSLLDDELDRA